MVLVSSHHATPPLAAAVSCHPALLHIGWTDSCLRPLAPELYNRSWLHHVCFVCCVHVMMTYWFAQTTHPVIRLVCQYPASWLAGMFASSSVWWCCEASAALLDLAASVVRVHVAPVERNFSWRNMYILSFSMCLSHHFHMRTVFVGVGVRRLSEQTCSVVMCQFTVTNKQWLCGQRRQFRKEVEGSNITGISRAQHKYWVQDRLTLMWALAGGQHQHSRRKLNMWKCEGLLLLGFSIHASKLSSRKPYVCVLVCIPIPNCKLTLSLLLWRLLLQHLVRTCC